MKYAIISLLILCLCQTAVSSEVWVTTSQLTSKEKLTSIVEARRAQIHEADFISSFEAQLSHPVSPSVLANLLKLEDDAQSAALNGKFPSALRMYKTLSEKLEKIPDVAGLELITLNALIHIAELEDVLNTGEGPKAWRNAHAWSPDPLKEATEFSPKIREKFNGMRGTPSSRIEVTAPLESAVFIDGRRIPISNGQFRDTLEPGYHQISLLVPGSEWMIKTIHLKAYENRDVSFRPEPVVEGSCEDPHYTGSELPAKTRLLVSFGDCDRVYFEKAWFTVAGRRLESLVPGPSASSMMSEMLAVPEDRSLWSKLKSSTWFWAGVTAVAAGAVILTIQSQSQPTVVVPTNSLK